MKTRHFFEAASFGASKAPLLLLAFATTAFFPAHALAAKSQKAQPGRSVAESTLFYGGFAYAGAADKITCRYPNFTRANEAAPDGTTPMDKVCRDFFSTLDAAPGPDGSGTVMLNPWTKLKLGALAQKNDVPLVLSVGLTGEVILREKVSDHYTIRIQLNFDVLVLDFDEKEAVSSTPFYIALRDVSKEPFSDGQIAALIRKMIFSEPGMPPKGRFADNLREHCAKAGGRGKNMLRMQVRPVAYGGPVAAYLPSELKSDAALYTELLGMQLTEIFGSENNVAMLPFSMDARNAKMSLLFADASRLDFVIPEPSFTLEVSVDNINKYKEKENAFRMLWAYDATGGAIIKEPLSGKEFFNRKVSFKVPKFNSSAKTEIDEFPTVEQAIRGLFKTVAEDANKNKAAREGVLNKCRL
jgi:hypothetical protein